MGAEPTGTQEKQNMRTTVMLTPSEKADVQLVARFHEATESDTLRDLVIRPIRDMASDIRAGRAKRRAA